LKTALKSIGEGLEELSSAIQPQIVEGKMLQFHKAVKFLGLEGCTGRKMKSTFIGTFSMTIRDAVSVNLVKIRTAETGFAD
jgi:hypothetical protein